MTAFLKAKPQFKLDVVTGIRLTTDEWQQVVEEANARKDKPAVLIRNIIRRYFESKVSRETIPL
jgi:hypothetical protein